MLQKFDKVEQLTVLVIGDLMLDIYLSGSVERISPEAPIPIVKKEKTIHIPGGAANVAANLKSLGAEVILMGTMANDINGKILRKLCQDRFGEEASIFALSSTTTSKTRIVAQGQQMLRIDEEDARDISFEVESELLSKLEEVLKKKKISAIVLQDYNKGLFTASSISEIIKLANAYKISYFVDPKFKNFWEFKGASIFKPNSKEIKAAFGPRSEDTSFDKMLLEGAKRLECDLLLCTMAEKGISIVEDKKIFNIPTEKIEVIDVSGAGDTTLAMATLAYLLGYSPIEIGKLGNLAGKVVCQKSGVSTITLNEVKSALNTIA